MDGMASLICRTGNKDYLRIAEHDISDYCSNLFDDEGDELERCWVALNFLEQRMADAEQSCDVEIKNGVVNGVDCQRLDKFQDFVREMVSQGNVKNMAKTLAVLAGAEKRAEARKAAGVSSESASSSGAVTRPGEIGELAAESVPGSPAADALRNHLADIFERFDVDHNGRLDAIEFREAMKELGDELSAESVKIIFSSMGIYGFVDMEQFVNIVEAEEVRAHSRFSKSLRSISRGNSKWWSDMPSSIDQFL